MLESPLTVFGRLPATIRLLVAGTLVNKLGTFIIPYLAIILRREFSLSAAEIAGLMAAYGAGSIVSILAGGMLTDRLGRRLSLLVSLFGSGALALAMGLSPSIRTLVPLLLLFGFLADLYRPASAAIIGDTLPSPRRATGFAALRLAHNLGFAFGMGLGGILADWSWRALFLADGLTTLTFGVMVYFLIPETHPATLPGSPPSRLGPADSPWRDRVFLETILVSVAFALMFFTHLTALPLTITVSAGYPALVFGFVVGLNGLLIALFEMSLVEWLQRYRRLRVAALGLALSGLGFGMTGLVMHWAWFLLTVILWTAGEILASPQMSAFVADWAPPAGRGRYLSVFQATWSVAFALNPILALPLHARLPEPLFWPLLLLIGLPASALLLRLDRTADHFERLRGLSEAPVPEAALLSTPTPEG